jgi:hypothetical protein
MKFGLGYNRLTGDLLPTLAVLGSSVSSTQGGGGQQVTSSITTITDVETLHKTLGVSVDAGGSYMGFSASAKTDYLNSCDFSSFSTYAIVQISIKNATETIDSPVFSQDANELLAVNNQERFRERFGDSFISGIIQGGEYFAIYQITGSDQSERESVGVKVSAAFKAPLSPASASLDVDIQTAMTSSKSHLKVQCFVFRQGAISTVDQNFLDIIKTARDFPISVAGDKAFSYSAVLQDYSGLKSPNDEFLFIDIHNQQQVLEDLAKRRFEFLALRDDLKYIMKNLKDFHYTDGTPVDRGELKANFDSVVDAINVMQEQARACTRDATKCVFTKFDTSQFNLPVPKQRDWPVIAGTYKQFGGSSVVQFAQNDRFITTSLSDPAFDHVAEGVWNDSFFEYTVTRMNTQNGCMTKLFGKLIVEGEGRLKVELSSSDGKCDLPLDFTEESIWIKAQ